VFAGLAERGVATLLWYGIFEADVPIHWTKDVRGRLTRPPWRAEYACPDSDAGLAGCGLLGANLEEGTEAELTGLASELGRALQPRITGLRYATARSDDEANPVWHPLGARNSGVQDPH